MGPADAQRDEPVLAEPPARPVAIGNRFKEKYAHRIEYDGIDLRPTGSYDESKIIRDLKKLPVATGRAGALAPPPSSG